MEVAETYVGGLESNKHASDKLNLGRGHVGKTVVAGIMNRVTNRIAAEVVDGTTCETLHDLVFDHVELGVTIYTDEAKVCNGLDRAFIHEAVSHSKGEYVRKEDIHTNGIESFWSMQKRAHKATFHRMSKKHLQRYVTEFVTRHNIREIDTHEQMSHIVAGLTGEHLMYQDLTA